VYTFTKLNDRRIPTVNIETCASEVCIEIRNILSESTKETSAHAVVLAILLPVPKNGALKSYKTSWLDQKLHNRVLKH